VAQRQKALNAFKRWYENLPAQPGGFPARGTIGAALVVLERLKEDFNLRLESHRAKGGQSQIRGVSGVAVTHILARFGERRPFLREGGRTNRGAPGDIGRMLRNLQQADLLSLTAAERIGVIERLQEFLVEKVREFHGRQRLKVLYDPAKTTQQFVQDLLKIASETGKAGGVAQHLVGAKLQLRFPSLTVENRPFSAADVQLGRPGDYIVGTTAFHVTVAPMPGVYERCRENLERGLRVYLLVPEQKLIGARQNSETVAAGRIAVESIESFVSQNIEELSAFSGEQLADQFRQLLETYNRRVDEAQDDKSLMVEIPPNLRKEG